MFSVIFTFISTLIMIWLVMWGFFKFMYPKPPNHYYPKEGDVLTPRQCDYCGHSLEQYRGIVEKKSNDKVMDNPQDNLDETVYQEDGLSEDIYQETIHQKTTHQTTYQDDDKDGDKDDVCQDEWFFCNEQHQSDFHAGKCYQP